MGSCITFLNYLTEQKIILDTELSGAMDVLIFDTVMFFFFF